MDGTFPVYQIHSDLDFYRHVFRTRPIFGLEMLEITSSDENIVPKVVVAKFYYHKSPISEALDEPFKQHALAYLDPISHPDPRISPQQTLTFLNIDTRRVGCLYRMHNNQGYRIPTMMIIRDGIILAEQQVHSEPQLRSFIARHMDPVLGMSPHVPVDFSLTDPDYANILQFPQQFKVQRVFDNFYSIYNDFLHSLIGKYVPEIKNFPNGPVGYVAKMLCYLVDAYFYVKNDSMGTSRFIDQGFDPFYILS